MGLFKNANRKLEFVNEKFKKSKYLASYGFIVAEKAQCVLLTAENHGSTAIQQKFGKHIESQRQRPQDSSVIRGVPVQGGHLHTCANGCEQISDEKNEILRTRFNRDPRKSLRAGAAQIGMHQKTTWHFLIQKLKLYQSNLQMHLEFIDLYKQNRFSYTKYRLRK